MTMIILYVIRDNALRFQFPITPWVARYEMLHLAHLALISVSSTWQHTYASSLDRKGAGWRQPPPMTADTLGVIVT